MFTSINSLTAVEALIALNLLQANPQIPGHLGISQVATLPIAHLDTNPNILNFIFLTLSLIGLSLYCYLIINPFISIYIIVCILSMLF